MFGNSFMVQMSAGCKCERRSVHMHVTDVNMRLLERKQTNTHEDAHPTSDWSSLCRPVPKEGHCCPLLDINVKCKPICAPARLTSPPQEGVRGHITGLM